MQDSTIDKYEPVLTIGTVAAQIGISVQSIRLYEKEGLVLPHKTESGHRMFSMHDLDRLKCIREMLTTGGLNINGARRLMSMVPCWDYKGGLDEDCRNCPVYYEANGPCWTRGDVGPKCQLVNCRDCAVYRLEINCHKMKEIIFGHKPIEKK